MRYAMRRPQPKNAIFCNWAAKCVPTIAGLHRSRRRERARLVGLRLDVNLLLSQRAETAVTTRLTAICQSALCAGNTPIRMLSAFAPHPDPLPASGARPAFVRTAGLIDRS